MRRQAERRVAEEDPGIDALLDPDSEEHDDSDIDRDVGRFHGLLHDKRKLATGGLLFLLLVVAIYFLFPKIVGFDDTLAEIENAKWGWVAIAVLFNVAAFVAYVALFRGVLGGTTRGSDVVRDRLDAKASYQITMAGLAATRIFSAAGAGGIAVTYWALRKAGMPRGRSACRMVAFLVLTYTVYLLALIVFGILLRTGVLPGKAPVGGTIVPASVAGVVLLLILLVSLIPDDIGRRIDRISGHPRAARFAARLAKGPATVASGSRTALAYVRHPRRGALAVAGAVGFWAAQIGILWASFEAFGAQVPFAVLVQGFFLGMAANLVPSPAGGVGSVDAGMIAAFVLFGIPSGVVFPAVLTYRVIAFWLPIPPGIVAYFQLRKTVTSWDEERAQERRARGYTSESKVTPAEAT